MAKMILESATYTTREQLLAIQAKAWEDKIGRPKRPEDVTMYGEGIVEDNEDGTFSLVVDTESKDYAPIEAKYSAELVSMVEEPMEELLEEI